MDAEGLQRTRDSNPGKAGEEIEGMEGEGRQNMRPGVSDLWLQSEARFPRLLKGVCGTGEVRQGRLLAAQVPFDIRHAMPMGWSRSAHGAAMAGSL